VTDEPHVLFERRGAVGLVTLNRPKALNALTHGMCLGLKAQLDRWAADSEIATLVIQGAGERAFCAGGDIRSLYESGMNKTPYAINFYRDEYILNAAIKHFPKPYVALIGGIVMGGGVGVSVHGSHRVADETTLFAMPETVIGLFPDVGGSYFLPRLSGGIGLYLALTGARLKTADALYAGIATHFVYADNRLEIIRALASGQEVETLLAEFAEDAGSAPLAEHRELLDEIFAADSVEEIIYRLDHEGCEWSLETVNAIRAKSPTATKLAFRQIREGAKLEFDDCMRMEFRMVSRVIAGHDFYEGVRATIIVKDGAPKWQPNRLEDVSDADIDAYFAPLGGKELTL
jgi:enoyl-CoA hydratase